MVLIILQYRRYRGCKSPGVDRAAYTPISFPICSYMLKEEEEPYRHGKTTRERQQQQLHFDWSTRKVHFHEASVFCSFLAMGVPRVYTLLQTTAA